MRYDSPARRAFLLFLDGMARFDSRVGEYSGLLRVISARASEEAEQLTREHVLGFGEAIRSGV